MIRTLLTTLFLLLPVSAQAAWYEASSDHFVVYSDDKPERIRSFVSELERYDRALRIMRGIPNAPISPASRVVIYVLDDVDDIRRLSGQSYIAGFYSARASGSVAFVPRNAGSGSLELNARTILFHEYAHHFMFANWGHATFPSWFIEGFAEFHATAIIDTAGNVVFGKVALHRAYGVLRDDPMPMSRLLLADPAKARSDDVDGLYARGWLLTHFLTFDPARKGQLERYIATLNRGGSLADAAAVLGDMKQLERDLYVYARSRQLPVVRIKAEAIPIGDVALRQLTPGEVATMPARIRSNRGVDSKSAIAVLALARKAAAPFPTDQGAQLVLAEAEYDAGYYNEAEAAADRALAVKPDSSDALLYKAMARMQIASKAGATDDATWREVRKPILAANKRDPEDPEPLMLFYRSYLSAGQVPTANARVALEKAFTLAPYDDSLRLMAVQVYLNDGRTQLARAALAPLAYRPHGGALAKRATEMIAAIDRGDPKATLADKLIVDEDNDGGDDGKKKGSP